MYVQYIHNYREDYNSIVSNAYIRKVCLKVHKKSKITIWIKQGKSIYVRLCTNLFYARVGMYMLTSPRRDHHDVRLYITYQINMLPILVEKFPGSVKRK